ncbi:MAG: Zn-binding domain-containing protein [bacterium]
MKEAGKFVIGEEPTERVLQCSDCGGTGRADDPEPLNFQELQSRVIDIQLNRDINPTNGHVPDFFRRVESASQTVYDEAEMAFNVALRRELSQDEFGLEPLGLAKWCVTLPEDTGAFEPLTESESKVFLRIVTRILASENILLPPNPYKPWAWPRDQVAEWERYVMIPASGRQKGVIPYNLRHYRKLGRYAQAVADMLLESGRLPNDEERKSWIAGLYWPLWNALQPYGFGVMDFAGKKINGKPPMGIRIDVFELHPVGDTVEQCQSCGYIMSEALLHVCARCGHRTEPTAPSDLDNFYRRIARFALPDVDYDDPYPLRCTEHTAQISRTEARNIERWFQDLFRENQHPADYRVDVLSVTTTMEMGIDIGSLLTVGLRNVPPTVANYQQRSGRAGRRGSSIATVLTYAQFRSHDQYYFDRPPEIVSAPPRVPALYLENEIIARRHVRSLVLQDFFYRAVGRKEGGGGLFRAWGRVKGFENRNRAEKLQKYLSTNRAPLVERCEEVVHPSFCDDLPEWMGALVEEVQEAVEQGAPKASLLETLIGKGLLPKYAFPVDVVGLSVPSSALGSDSDPYGYEDRMQRDLRIALAEYAPGAEVIKGSFPDTYICRVAGVYDPFDKDPDYRPTGKLLECPDCQAIDLLDAGASAPDSCPECGSFGVYALPYLRPNGFTVDQAEPNAGCEEYRYGGREWAGYVAPARLLVGETSLASGESRAPYAPDLYTRVEVGELFVCNKGPDRSFPGFLICPDCGRALDPDDPSSHTYPAPVPPHRGRHKGPRAGELCPNRSDFQNMVVLGHNFHSEVVLFGVDLPQTMDAPFLEVAGKAVWYSLGTLIKNAATVVLQVDPEEVAVGVRPIRRSPGRIHGEIFIYDNVPGGAGYARAIDQHMEAILLKALDLGEECSNPECSGACYHCLFDYRNQYLHPLLDRELGVSVLRYLLHGKTPGLNPQQADKYAGSLAEYVRATWKVLPGQDFDDVHIARVFEDKQGRKYGVHVIHPVQARPTKAKSQAVLAALGVRLVTHTSFDLERRPFWVVNNLA